MPQLEQIKVVANFLLKSSRKNRKFLRQNRAAANLIFEETIGLPCALSNSRKGKAGNTFHQCEYEHV